MSAVVESVEEMASELASEEVASIPLMLIEVNDVALRGVRRDDEQYVNLVNSIRDKGVLNSVLVKKIIYPGDVIKYILIDGLQRFSASQDAGRTHIPARIVDMDEGEILEAQVIANVTRIQTKPAELAEQLRRILARNPMWSRNELAKRVSQSVTWVDQRLALTKLDEKIKPLVDNGEIHLMNAYAISKLPIEEQGQHVQAAISEPHTTFVPKIKERCKEIRAAARKGKDAGEYVWQPVKSVRKKGDLLGEFEQLEAGGESSVLVAMAEDMKLSDVTSILHLAMSWCLNFDPESQKEQARKHEVQVKAKEEEKERKKKEREEQKAKKAAEEAADITTNF